MWFLFYLVDLSLDLDSYAFELVLGDFEVN